MEVKVMEKKELKERFIDEKTGIEYVRQGDYYIPNLVIPMQEKIQLNKYGRMRLKYLKEYQKTEYTIMLMEGTLTKHLKEIQETATKRVNQVIEKLKEKNRKKPKKSNTQKQHAASAVLPQISHAASMRKGSGSYTGIL